MKLSSRIDTLARKRPLLGPLLWLSACQFFIAQIVVSWSWSNPPYSWSDRTISELGAVACGVADGRYMCSPAHIVMNLSFLLLGFVMTAGSLLLYRQIQRSRAGFLLMGLAGLGAILVGFVPMDTIYWLHIVGADIAFLFGNIALIVFGFTLRMPRWFKMVSIILGVVGLAGLYLFLSRHHILGLGGTERIVAYPIIVWLTATGAYLLVNPRFLARQSTN